jgi:adenosylcobinamide-GDP ribazoletransferase
VRGFRAAVSLLTRVPVGGAGSGSADLARAVPWFPVVGALVGLALAGSYAGFLLVAPPLVAAGLTLGLSLFLTGALHEDGLADTADALGGARNREDALRILSDPAHGTYGVLSIVLSVILRVAALASLDGWTAAAVLPGAHALSRGAAVALLGALRPAAEQGLGASYAATTTRREVALGVAAALAAGLVVLGGWVLPAALLVALGAGAVGVLSARRIGGITGDVLGASQQVGEVLVLLLGAAAVVGGWPSPAWWR